MNESSQSSALREAKTDLFIAHRSKRHHLLRLLVTPIFLWAGWRIGMLGVVVIQSQPIFGLVMLLAATLLITLGLWGGAFNLYRIFTPASVTIRPEGMIYVSGNKKEAYAWGDLSEVRLITGRGVGLITFKDIRHDRRRSLPGDWNPPCTTLYSRIMLALAGDFSPKARVIVSGRDHRLRNLLYWTMGSVPYIGVLIGAVILANHANHRDREILRTTGELTSGVVGAKSWSVERGGAYNYKVSYSFIAWDKEAAKPRRFSDEVGTTCLIFWKAQTGRSINIVYAQDQPTLSRLDANNRFRRGMSDSLFQDIWRPGDAARSEACRSTHY